MYTFKSFNTSEAMVDYLNGVVFGKALPPLVLGLHGLTLIVAGKTVTFADATGAGLSPRDILNQVHAADPSLSTVILRNYGYDLKQPSLAVMTAAQTVSKLGTANALLGFSVSADVTVTAVDKASIISEQVQLQGPQYSVLLDTTVTPLDFGGDLSAARATSWIPVGGRENVSFGGGWPTGIVGVVDFELSNHGQAGVAGAPYKDGDGNPAIPTAKQPAGTAANVTVRGLKPEAALFVRATWTPGAGNAGTGKYFSNDSGVVGTSATLAVA